ncbi:hypothetical protein B296_00004036 [Ensete ventricosum]|uniref:Uncharacterized protein n=1 Tax=Ensete ventricosum TaxID=4639 RepID=A0A427B6Q5_ENSVE|nr:hypothetical protein B296_00004036 [Ensete ventricosum]
MDEKASKALEAMLRAHDEDSVITESFLPHIKTRYHISGEYDLYKPQGNEACIHGIGPTPQALSATNQPCFEVTDPPAKKTKVLVSKEAPRKDARHVAAPKKVAPPEASRWEGSSRQRDKAVSQSKVSGEGQLKARWATLTPQSKVWADGVGA